LISGCSTSKPEIVVIEELPQVFPSEIAIQPYPIKPPVHERTNCTMHNYRLKVEEWGCDSLMLFGGFVKRLTDTDISIPMACVKIIREPRNYMDCGEE